MSRILPSLFAILLLALAVAVHADDGATTLNITAHAEREVDNDLMTVHLSVERRAAEVGQAVAEVNRLMRAALERASAEPSVDARSLSYSTSPVYDRDRTRVEPVSWQVTQVLELKGKDFEALTRLTGEMQKNGLAISQLFFSVSREARAVYQQELLAEAVGHWQRVAKDMAAAIGASHVFPKDLTLHDDGFPGPRPMLAMRMMDEMAASPALEAGQSALRVTVSGQARAYGAPTLQSASPR
jgi:predicted secreted protein